MFLFYVRYHETFDVDPGYCLTRWSHSYSTISNIFNLSSALIWKKERLKKLINELNFNLIDLFYFIYLYIKIYKSFL